MAKKRRKNSRKSRKPDRSRSVKELREAIDERRGRRAHALAKQLEKSGQPGDYAELLAKAYSVRAREMLADGHCPEAADMVDAFIERNADGASHLDDRLSVNLDCFRDQPRLLHQWGDSAWSDRLTSAISCGLLNLEWLRDAPGLPADHELRLQAGVLLRLWHAIEAGAAVEDLEGWQVISRRSPLIHWRLFLQALGAYYEHNDDIVEANLRRIPDESAVKTLAEGLRCLLREQAPPGEAGAAIWDRARGHGLEAELEHCQQLLDSGSKGAEPAVMALARKLEAEGRHQLAADVRAMGYYRQGRADDKLSEYVYQGMLSGREALLVGRLHHLTDFEPAPFIQQILDSGLSLSPSEEGFLWLALAKDQEDYLASLTETLYRSVDFDFEEEWEILDGYFLHSVDCCPRSAAFGIWHLAARRFQMDDAHILDKWEKAVPEDPDFLRAKRRTLYDQGRFDEALKTLDRLIELEGNTPTLQAERAWNLIEEARQCFYEGELDRVEEILAGVAAQSADQTVARDVLLWQAAGSDRGMKRARGQALEAHEEPVMILANARFIDPALSLHQLPAGVKRQFDDPGLVLKSFRSVCELPEACIWYKPDNIDLPKVTEVFSDETVDCGELLSTLEVLGGTSAMFADTFSFDIAQVITRNGLRRKRGPKALFLAWHALLYIAELDDLVQNPAQANLLLGAAAWLAKREKQDDEAVADLAMRLGQFADPRERIKDYTRKQVNQLVDAACTGPGIYVDRRSPYGPGPFPFDNDFSGSPGPIDDSAKMLTMISMLRQMKELMPPNEWNRMFRELCTEMNLSKEQECLLLDMLEMNLSQSLDFLNDVDPDPDLPDPAKLPFDDLWS